MFSLNPAWSYWPGCLAPRIHSRSIISVKAPRVYPKKTVPRIYSERKTFLYNQYLRLLETSSSSPIIFLQHNNFKVPRLVKLRRDITIASDRVVPSLAAPSPAPVTLNPPPKPSLTIVRTALLGVALRDFAPLDVEAGEKIANMVEGGLAVLTLPTLNPPQLHAILRALDRAVPAKKPETEEEKRKREEAKNADPVAPGRRPKRVKPDLTPELTLVGALIDGRVFTPEAVKDVSRLPTLETLRAQIVGLLSSPATQLAAVLSEASGGKLARTLEGLKKSLEEGQDAEVGSS